jgi:hypothetical protein
MECSARNSKLLQFVLLETKDRALGPAPTPRNYTLPTSCMGLNNVCGLSESLHDNLLGPQSGVKFLPVINVVEVDGVLD